MTIREVATYIVTCDGCGRTLSDPTGRPRIYHDTWTAHTAALTHGWASHPDHGHYCPEGNHS